ncbi:MAG TPA: peptide ABC transporter substrate-binding protein [Bacteroidia bacterium]|nr:peptide ABC transporter substrate-binding protein [Bacteroidia bacterium]
MKRLCSLFVSVILIGFISSCGTGSSSKNKKVAKGNRVYGGVVRLNEITPFFDLYPYYIYDNISYLIASQLYDGLVRINPKDLSIVPDIAKKWEVDTSGTIYTFHLTKGVTFQDDPCFTDGKGRKVTADDFKYSMEKLCTFSPDNVIYSITFKGVVEGADDFYERSKKGKVTSGISGIKVLNDSTIQIKLLARNPGFLNVLAGPGGFVLAQEAVEKYGQGMHVGTGPFTFSTTADSQKVVLTANPNYFRFDSAGNQLPYIDSVVITFVNNKMEEFNSFQKGSLDFIVGVPSSQVDKMVEEQIADFQQKPPKYLLARVPEMSTQYYAFNISKAPFNDVRVRKALSMAIDRNKIINDILEGEAFAPGIHGITPPSFMTSKNPEENYNIANVKGDTLNVELAKKLLAEAGYPEGKNFPSITLELNSGGGLNTSVAVEVQKELLNNLNVKLNLNIVSFSQKLADSRYGRFDMVRAGWIADYANPADFLMLFYGGNVPDSIGTASYYNVSRYKNPEFDKLFEMGRSSSTTAKRYQYYLQAEQVAMNDAPLMVLWYDQNYSLTRWTVKDLFSNPMKYVDLSCVYVDDRGSKNAKDSTKKK